MKLPWQSPPARAKLSFAAWFLVACVLTLALEAIAEHSISSARENEPGLAPSVFQLNGVYQRVVASGPRSEVPRFTAIVQTEFDSTQGDVCSQRRPLANLIRAIGHHRPTTLVIDRYFGASCQHDAGTDELVDAIREVSRFATVIVGRRINDRIAPTARGYPLLPALHLADGQQIREALVNIDRDTTRVALGWTVVDESGHSGYRPSIALAAAEAYDRSLLEKQPLLKFFRDERIHPYVSFIRSELEKQWAYRANEVLCAESRACSKGEERDLTGLGHIVLIGNVNPDMDFHFSVLGRVPGFLLQANYIEALLDQRYFRPVSPWVNYLAGFLIYVFFHWVLIKYHHAAQNTCGLRVLPIIGKAVVWGILIMIGTVGSLYLIVMHTGWYVNPATMGVVVIVMKYGELVFAACTKQPAEAHRGRDESIPDRGR